MLMPNAIEITQLSMRYGSTVALDDVTLMIPSGSIYGFIGPNGAGKTTTLRLLAGLMTPTSGTISLMGERLDHHGYHAHRTVGYMPDFFGVYNDLRVWEYLDFFARCYGLSAARRRTTVEQLLELVDLLPKRDAFVQHLSRGMQQRLCLAHALVHDPPILLLDEPASGLDPRARVELRELLRTLRDMGKTILVSSHILSELAEISTEIGILHHGRIIVSGSVADVRRHLCPNPTIHMRVVHDPAHVSELLHALAHTPQHETLPRLRNIWSDSIDPTLFHLQIDQATREQQALLLTHLITHGIRISDYYTEDENLETLFLRLLETAP